jgi:hypothetical protein
MEKNKQNIRILYIYPGALSTFMAKDIRLLEKHYQVKTDFFPTKNKKLLPYYLIRQFISYFFATRRTDVFIIKFGGYWSLAPTFIAKLMGKKSIIITGGTDCVGFPSLGYGNFQNPSLARFTKKSFQLASHIVALHPSMMEQEYTYDICIHPKQGLRYHIPQLNTPWTVIYNGYDPAFWKSTEEKNPKTLITVASGLGEERRRKLKGIDLILQIAPRFPEYTFQIVGTTPNELPKVPNNVELIGKKKPEELTTYYGKARFYLQLSLSEGFPNSLCEAMLCNCIPIVSRLASMPFIVEDTGYILEKNDLAMLESLLNKAFTADNSNLGLNARNRIATNFTEAQEKKA